MSIYIVYNDDYCVNGGHGLMECSDRTGAIGFIIERMKQHPQATFDKYIVIEGERLSLVTEETVTHDDRSFHVSTTFTLEEQDADRPVV